MLGNTKTRPLVILRRLKIQIKIDNTKLNTGGSEAIMGERLILPLMAAFLI